MTDSSDLFTLSNSVNVKTCTFKGSRKIIFRNYEMSDEAKFLHDLDQEMIKGSLHQQEEAFAVFSSVFRDLVDRHAPLKQKTVRGNNTPYLTKQLNKAILDRPGI